MTLSSSVFLGEGKGRGVTEPFFPGVKVGEGRPETQMKSPELDLPLQARLDPGTLSCSLLPAVLLERDHLADGG